ncbi:hypothetical protein E2562_018659 [Oryza meyeriana var. granulata]|uniref:Uncharacterized protein n=1 Tax=Oryza meyeriana var. granulata TaxID=110450 RepID=A0A6G1BY96_9ORYZ|nr:hypothetical protein E2562_018659 [Oryza meyeriana var. granulata]
MPASKFERAEKKISPLIPKLSGEPLDAAAGVRNWTGAFGQLLGHCGEALGIASRRADAIESRLVSFGYVLPEVEASEDVEEDWDVQKLPGDPGN